MMMSLKEILFSLYSQCLVERSFPFFAGFGRSGYTPCL